MFPVILHDILLRSHCVDAAILAQAEQLAAQTQVPLVHVLVRYEVVDERKLAHLLSRALQVELIDVSKVDVHPRLLAAVPRYAAERLRVLPIGAKKTAFGECLYLAMSDPSDEETIAVVEKAIGHTVEALVCNDNELSSCFDKRYGVDAEAPVLVGKISTGAEFLTESTAEAMRCMQAVGSATLPQLVAPIDDDNDDPAPPQPTRLRPVSMALAAALAESTAEFSRGPITTVDDVRRILSSECTLETRRHAAEGTQDEALYPKTVEVPSPLIKTPEPSMHWPAGVVVALAMPKGLGADEHAALRTELRELPTDIEFNDDDAAACRTSAGASAVVLLAPRPQSALWRALLDLEDLPERPKIIVLGGDTALQVLSFLDHRGDLPTGARAIAVPVYAALHKVGVLL